MSQSSRRRKPFTVVEASIADMRAALEAGATTSVEIVTQYLTRIATYDDRLHAALAVNPQRAAGGGGARPRAARGTRARTAARHPDRREGQHPHDEHADDRRRAGVRRIHAALRGDARDEPQGRRRDHHREDRHDRARQLGGRRADADADQLQRGRRVRLQSLRSAARSARDDATAGPVLATGGSSSGIGTAASFWAGERRHGNHPDRSSARRTRTCSRASSRRSAASAATA